MCSAYSRRKIRGLKLEIVLIDRPVDPVTEGFDIAIGAFPHSFGGVVDEPLYRDQAPAVRIARVSCRAWHCPGIRAT